MNKQAINPISRGARVAFWTIGFLLVCGIFGSHMAFGALPNLPIDTPAGGSTFSDTTADFVLGQPDFTTSGGAPTSTGMTNPNGVAFDASGRLFVAHEISHRVLVFNPDGLAQAPTADTSLPVSQVIVVTTGATTFSAPIGTTDTFVQINLSGGDSTVGDSSILLAAAKADSIGATFATADYTETWGLVNSNDSVVMPIWTNQTSLKTFIGMRSDTASIAAASLPPGISNSDVGRRAFGATAILGDDRDSFVA